MNNAPKRLERPCDTLGQLISQLEAQAMTETQRCELAWIGAKIYWLGVHDGLTHEQPSEVNDNG